MFFDIGFWEIGVIFVVALLVFGPEKLPSLIRQTGYWLGKAQSTFRTLRSEMEHELRIQELKDDLNPNNILNPENEQKADITSDNSDVEKTEHPSEKP